MPKTIEKGRFKGKISGDYSGELCECGAETVVHHNAGFGRVQCPECHKHSAAARRTSRYFQSMVTVYRARAKRNSLPFNLTPEYIESIAPEKCPVFGTDMLYGAGDRSQEAASLDKIIPSEGYVVGNVQWMSKRANMMKSNATPEQLKRFAEWIIQNYEV